MRQETGASFIEENIVLKKCCEDLKEFAIEIIDYEEKEMTTLANNETSLYEKQKTCHISKGGFCYDKNKKK